jgi:hypothetical protein
MKSAPPTIFELNLIKIKTLNLIINYFLLHYYFKIDFKRYVYHFLINYIMI